MLMVTIILNNINNICSIFPPLFLTTAYNLPSKASHAARSFSWKLKFYSRRKFAFNLSSDCLFSTLTWSIAYFLCLIEFFTTLQTVSRRICSFSRWRNYCGPSCGELQSYFYLSSFPKLNS